ncbi:MalY/PatB family protein [Enterococcus faecalis]|uniref:MalY/PatB family protein n=1 Tax=Enterococcus faecalis TaxID=1351 RepID=UPI0001F0C74E|nr:MalY/PatB family protein [Enterococcus faecalis]EFT95190.1 aminotransferase, class I/II [Enterococcus faecalis TX0012]
MPFDFDQIINRKNTNSLKWTVESQELPMWVADMDFNTAPVIIEAIKKRLDQGALGYSVVPDSFKESIVSWWQRKHNWTIEKEWVLFCTGAIPAISSIVRKMTTDNEGVVLLTPVYNVFFNSILNNNREVLVSELNYESGNYTIDFADLEEKLSRDTTKLLIFCNPHNPIGKVWEKKTLEKVGSLCIKYKVLILSDELHCDLTHKFFCYTPIASVSKKIEQQTITCVAPTKAFNLAGLQTSAIIVPNKLTRELVERGINTDEVAEPNVFAIQAAEAAFNEGELWLEELIIYLEENKKILDQAITTNIPEINIVPSSATYLAWLDCSQLTEDTEYLCHFIRDKTGLYLSEGEIFGGNGNQFIRWNYACPKSVLMEGIKRFEEAIKLFKEMPNC